MKTTNLPTILFSLIILLSTSLKGQEAKTTPYIFSNETIGLYFFEDMARVNIGGKYGFIDRQGFLQIPCQYDNALNFQDGLAIVRQKDKYSFIRKDGSLLSSLVFDSCEPFSE